MFSYNKIKLIKNQSPHSEKLMGLFLFKAFVIELYLIKTLLSPGLNYDPTKPVQLSRKHKLSLIIRPAVQFSHSVVSHSLSPHESQHARPPGPSPSPRVHSNSCPSSQWCHPPISSSVVPFSSCYQSLPASGSFPMSQLFTWGGQSTGVSASASFLPKNTQDWSLEWTGWISLQSKGLARVFSNTTVQKHQFFGAQLSSQSNTRIHTWPWSSPNFLELQLSL